MSTAVADVDKVSKYKQHLTVIPDFDQNADLSTADPSIQHQCNQGIRSVFVTCPSLCRTFHGRTVGSIQCALSVALLRHSHSINRSIMHTSCQKFVIKKLLICLIINRAAKRSVGAKMRYKNSLKSLKLPWNHLQIATFFGKL